MGQFVLFIKGTEVACSSISTGAHERMLVGFNGAATTPYSQMDIFHLGRDSTRWLTVL